MDMGAIVRNYGNTRASVLAVIAGADALLMKSDLSRDTVIDTMHRVCGVTETDHA